MSQHSDTPITKALAEKAGLIFMMEAEMQRELEREYRRFSGKIICLDIPYEYERGSIVLMRLFSDALSPYLNE